MTLGQFFASTSHFGNFERQHPEKFNFAGGNFAIHESGFEHDELAPCEGVWICLLDNMQTEITSTGGSHTKQVADQLNLAMVEARKRALLQQQEDETDATASMTGSTSTSSKSSSWETAKNFYVSVKGSIKSRGGKLAKACKSVVRKMTPRVVSSKTSTTNAIAA